MQAAGRKVVVNEAAFAFQQPLVFDAPQRLANRSAAGTSGYRRGMAAPPRIGVAGPIVGCQQPPHIVDSGHSSFAPETAMRRAL